MVWLYPKHLNLYGDRGNIECLKRRLEWRGLQYKLVEFNVGDSLKKLTGADLFFAGGGPDSLQREVSADAFRLKPALIKAQEQGRAGLFICGFYQLLGRFYRPAEGADIPGLGIFDCYTEHFGARRKRCVGNIVTTPLIPLNPLTPLVGFENHEGRTYLCPTAKPLAKVQRGFGNNGQDKTEGIIKGNFVGTYLHGPLLPKNPHLADWLLAKALGEKLPFLDDKLEWQTHTNALKLK